MKTKLALVVLAMVFCACQGEAVTIYVDCDNEGGTEDGTSWATAWGTISEGADHLKQANLVDQGGHTVMVATGTYAETVSLYTNAHGGVAGKTNTFLAAGDVIIDGGSYVFYFLGESGNPCNYVTIDGFGLYDGSTIVQIGAYAGQITIRNCRIYHMAGAYYGVAITANGGPVLIENCVIWDTRSNGINCDTSGEDIMVKNCIIGNCGRNAVSETDAAAGNILVSNCCFWACEAGIYYDYDNELGKRNLWSSVIR